MSTTGRLLAGHALRQRDTKASAYGAPGGQGLGTNTALVALLTTVSSASVILQSGDPIFIAPVRRSHSRAILATVHSAHGRTVDRAAMVVDETTTREALYVGMTRGRVASTAVGGDDMEDLADHMKAGRRQADEPGLRTLVLLTVCRETLGCFTSPSGYLIPPEGKGKTALAGGRALIAQEE